LDEKYKKAVSVSYSPSGKELACASSYEQNHSNHQTILILNASNGQIIQKIEKDMHPIFIGWICYSPNGKYLASCSRDQSIKIWNAEKNYELIKTVYAHSD
jgi:WD40 repeat protein